MPENTSIEEARSRKYDAVVVPGGGLVPDTGEPRPWVKARLDLALKLDKATQYYIVLSRGTTHRAPPTDSRGVPIDESSASALYLLQHGVDCNRILQDSWSLDTIGNAYFTRQMITDPLYLRRLIVVTSAFHMPRTRAIFNWIFSLPCDSTGASNYTIDFCTADDVGLEAEELAARTLKESIGLETLASRTIPRVKSKSELARFVHVEHGAYNAESIFNSRLINTSRDMEEVVNQHVKDLTKNTY